MMSMNGESCHICIWQLKSCFSKLCKIRTLSTYNRGGGYKNDSKNCLQKSINKLLKFRPDLNAVLMVRLLPLDLMEKAVTKQNNAPPESLDVVQINRLSRKDQINKDASSVLKR